MQSGQIIGRHNALVKCLYDSLKGTNVRCETELKYGEHDRMGDLVLREWVRGADLWIDVSVVGSLCPSYRNKTINMRNGVAGSPGAEILARVQEKNTKYAANRSRTHFQPLVVNTFGGWDSDAHKLFKKIAGKIAESKFTCVKMELKYLYQRLSCTLQKFNGTMLATRAHIG